MPADGTAGPAARVLAAAEERNATLGHENLGALSAVHGFLARRPPEHDLPAPHDAWVAAVDELPDLCRTLRLRARLEELPLLDASEEALEDRHLLRAASVLGLLAHAYSNVPMRKPERLPDQLVRPWLQTAERLGRPAFTLTNSDYIFDNWRLVDPHAPDPMRVENMRLLTAIWDHPQMDTFILVLVELLARSAPLVSSAVRAQEACLNRDDDGLGTELVLMAETIHRLTHETLPKISANARSGPRRVDPVVWTKLFAMVPLPVLDADEGVRNASGAETPYFHLMDVVLGRRLYETGLGHEALQFRENHPPHWHDFIAAVGQHSIADYVRERGNHELSSRFAELGEDYHGRHGLLARHRLKAFAYMDAAFKTGRSSTVTGFTGLFEDRAWETVDASFEAARLERERSVSPTRRLARVEYVDDLCPGVRLVALDVRGLGMRCRPGDRCTVLPENEPGLVARTLRAMDATGDEPVELTREWMDALLVRPMRAPAERAPLRDLLTLGHIRPVTREAAKLLYELTADASLRSILEARGEDRWELWDLLELLASAGFDGRRLWQLRGARQADICQVVRPLEPRVYSPSSVLTAADGSAARIELTVEHLEYETGGLAADSARLRRGTASTYLCRTVEPGAEIPVGIVPAPGFSLPTDASIPIVMLADGVGIAPFVAFLRNRARTPGTQNLLFAQSRRAEALPHRELLLAHAERGEAAVNLALSEGTGEVQTVEDMLREPGTASRLRELVRGAGARIYVRGDAAFARHMMTAVGTALEEPRRPGRESLSEMIVQHRYVQEVLPAQTDHAAPRAQIDASELARHNNAADGIWTAIGGRVYDLTWFAEVHPGGHKLIGSFAGMDATSSYRIVEHHRDPAVDAMLPMFEIGSVRRLHFGPEPDTIESLFRRWVAGLYVLVEIENAHHLDTSIESEPLSRGEDAARLATTPYRRQFGIEAHGRFLAQTVPTVCRHFGRLWEAMHAPCGGREGAQALDAELALILESRSADVARVRCADLERMLEHEGAAAELDHWLSGLQAADADYLGRAKTLIASGVSAFEVHEARVLTDAGEVLLDALRELRALTAGYLDAVAAPQP